MKEFINESKRIIQKSAQNNKLVLFVGAGVSANSGFPLWANLIEKIKGKIKVPDDFRDELKIAQYYYNSRGEKEYYEFLKEEFNIEADPNLIHDVLLELNPCHIITTNYDDLIEKQAKKKGMFFDVVSKDTDLPYTPNNRMIIKMHGDLQNRNIVFKEDDYLSYSNNFKLIETYIKSLFSTNTILFVGYSLSDIDVKMMFQWIKDILGKDLPKPYFLKIDKIDSEIDMNEFEYYKNKGINILYYSQIAKFIDETNSEDTIGDRTYKAVKYLTGKEEKQLSLDNLYKYIDLFKDINFIDNKVIKSLLEDKLNLLCYSDYEIRNDKLYLYNDKLNKIISWINDDREKNHKEYEKIIKFLEKSNISYIIKETENDQESKKIYEKNKKKDEQISAQYLVEKFDYVGIKNYIYTLDDKKISNNFNLKFEKAYCYYYIKDYYKSYQEYKNLSENSFNKKNMVIYALAEFNRYYIGRMISNDWTIGETIRKNVKEEIEKINLDRLIYNLPVEIPQLDILKRILMWNFVQDNLQEMDNLRNKIESDENTCFFGKTSKDYIGIFILQHNIEALWNFIKLNMLAIDNYKEIKKLFYNYIDSLLKNYSAPKIRKEKENSFLGMEGENIKVEEFRIFDVKVMLEYISLKELESLFLKHEIISIKINSREIEELIQIFKNIIESYENGYKTNEIINKILFVLSKIKLSLEEYKLVNEYILNYLKINKPNNFISNKYINKYIYYQEKNYKMYDKDSLNNILVYLVNDIKRNNIEDFDFEKEYIIDNVSHIINKYYKKHKINIEIEDIIEKSKKRGPIENVLIDLYNISNKEEKNHIKDYIKSRLETNSFKTNEAKLYYEAVMKKIIFSNKKYEKNMQKLLDETIKEKESQKNAKTYPDYVEILLGYIINLILNNHIKDKELFKKYLGIKKDYDFLFNLEDNNVDADIDIEWLNEFSEELIRKIAENDSLKMKIKEKMKEKLLNDKNIDKSLLDKFLKYFC